MKTTKPHLLLGVFSLRFLMIQSVFLDWIVISLLRVLGVLCGSIIFMVFMLDTSDLNCNTAAPQHGKPLLRSLDPLGKAVKDESYGS